MLPPLREDDTPWQGVSVRFEAAGPGPCTDVPRRETDAPRFVRAALRNAVARTLEGARRVAVMTGGGLDSGGLLALAMEWARARGGEAFAVALDFESEGDDRPHLHALEQHLGCRVVRVRPEDTGRRVELFRTGVDGAPLPWATAPFEIEVLARAKSEGADCVLCGAGGDELFDGDPVSLARYTRRGRWLRAASSARAMRGFGDAGPAIGSGTGRFDHSWSKRCRGRFVAGAVGVRWCPHRGWVPSSPTCGFAAGGASSNELSPRSNRERTASLGSARTLEGSTTRGRVTNARWQLASRGAIRSSIRRWLPRSPRCRPNGCSPARVVVGCFARRSKGFCLIRFATEMTRRVFEPAVKATLDAAGGSSVLRDLARRSRARCAGYRGRTPFPRRVRAFFRCAR